MGTQLEEFYRETLAKILSETSAEKRLEGVPVEKRLEGISVAELLKALPPEKREELARQIQANGNPPAAGQ